MGFFDHLECPRCRWTGGPEAGTCPPCGGPLLARYRLDEARAALPRAALRDRERSLWRYSEILPEVTPVTLGEGGTPLLAAPRVGGAIGVPRLFIKDESVNPTGSFKARGMAVAVSVAAAHGACLIAAPSAGNAGSALAAYGARAGIPVYLTMPADTPAPCVDDARRRGARVQLVPGSIADAGAALRESLGPPGAGRWYDVATLREPFRVEGKKTMGLEIAEQMDFDLPEVIVYPTGGGTGIIGMWKAFDEMEALGWIGPRRPRMMAVQASGCAPIVRAFERGEKRAAPWADPRTIAPGLRVPGSLGDDLILNAVRQSGGAAVAVDDADILGAAARLAAEEGIDACPEGGAALAGLLKLKETGHVGRDDRVVLFNTGSGLKYHGHGGSR